MTPLPKRRQSRGRSRRRRAHDALKPTQLIECPQCHSKKLQHRVCPNCGYYRGEQVLGA